MLNRRILRIKAFKVIYALAENPEMTLKEAELELENSCQSTRDLYLFLLSIVSPLTAEAASRIEAARTKFNPTEDELHPNLKFVQNGIAPIFEEDIDFQKIVKRKKLSWEQYDMCIRHMYDSIRTKDYYNKYMQSGESSLQEDAALWVRIFEEEFVDNTELEDILEDLNLYWNDDIAYALTYCCRSVRAIAEGGRWSLPELYQSEMPGNRSMDSDKAFVTAVVRKAHAKFAEYYDAVASCTPKWDRNRICSTDLALIVCGLAEVAAFPKMSVKIIINEYVEISKYYSTPESRAFVNGVLDKLINKR